MTKASSWVSRLWLRRSGVGLAAKAKQRRAVRTCRAFFEPLEDQRLLAITTTFNSGVLTFTGDSADDKVVLEATGDLGTVNYDDSIGLGSKTQAGVTQVVFDGNLGNDQLLISHADGNLFAPIDGIVFRGGEGHDEVILGEGASSFVGVYTVSGAEAGNLSYTSSGATQSLDFDDVELLQDATLASSLAVNANSFSNTINIVDGLLIVPGSAIQQGPVVVDGGDRDDHGSFDANGPDNILGNADDGNQDGWKFIEQMLDYTLRGSFIRTATKDLLVIGANGSRALAAIQSVVGAGGLNLTSVDYITSISAIQTVDFSIYKGFYVPSDLQTSGGIQQAQIDALATRRTDITNFVRSGGAVVALTEAGTVNPYGWLAIPDQFQIGSTSGTIQRQTTFLADAFQTAGLSITNTELSRGTPVHNHFIGPVGFNGLGRRRQAQPRLVGAVSTNRGRRVRSHPHAVRGNTRTCQYRPISESLSFSGREPRRHDLASRRVGRRQLAEQQRPWVSCHA